MSQREQSDQSVLISIRNVRKEYRSGKRIVHALKGVSLDLYAGEVLSLLGANGAGKTTLSSILATLHPASDGHIMYNDESIYEDITQYRMIMGYCPQKPNLDPHITLKQNLLYAGQLYGLSFKAVNERVEHLVQQFGLERYVHFKVNELSGGYKQRFMIARTLIHEPKLVILDEPTVGLDPHIRRQIWRCIMQLKEQGITVVLTTHYLDEAEMLSDRICLLDKGEIKLIDTPNNLKKIHELASLEDVFVKLMEEGAV